MTYRVRLVVTYTLPACSGTPAAGTANVNGNTSIQVCDNSSFSLNCTGQATSTGIATNWQIGTSAGGPFSDILGASAATFSTSTTDTRYYRYRVTCSNSGLSSYSNVLTVTYSPLSSPTVTGTTLICASSSTTLTATGSGNPIQWYSDAAATNLLGTGTTYTTPSLSANTTYYVRQGASTQTFTYTSPVTATYTTGGAVSITVPSTPTGASGNGTLTVYRINRNRGYFK
jgi:hypothetical protein